MKTSPDLPLYEVRTHDLQIFAQFAGSRRQTFFRSPWSQGLNVETEMAEPVVNGEHHLDLFETRKALLSNSTKRRTSELYTLRDELGR